MPATPVLMNRALMLAKQETTYNVDAAPVPTLDAFLVSATDVKLNPNVLKRDFYKPSLSPTAFAIGRKLASVTFTHEVKGSGGSSTVPKLGTLLTGCGFLQTLIAATAADEIRTPVASSQNTGPTVTWTKNAAGTSGWGRYRIKVALGGATTVAKVIVFGNPPDLTTTLNLPKDDFSATVMGPGATTTVTVNYSNPLSVTYVIATPQVGDVIVLSVGGLRFKHTVASTNAATVGSAVAALLVDSRFSAVASGGSGAVAATGQLTATLNFIANETVTIGGVVYTFKASPSAAYEVLLGTGGSALADSLANLADAVEDSGVQGTNYGNGTGPNPYVTATSDSTHLDVTAITAGLAGNSILTSTDAADATWDSPSTHLAGGSNATGATVTVTVTGGVSGALTSGTTVVSLGESGASVILTWSGSLVLSDYYTVDLWEPGYHYTEVSTGFKSLTIYVYYDGTLHRLTGCIGTFSVTGKAGAYATAQFTFTGQYHDPDDEPLPSTSVFETTTPQQVELAQLLVGGSKAICAEQFTFDAAVTVNPRECVSASDGYNGVAYTSREPKGGCNPEMAYESEEPYWRNLAAATLLEFHVRVGSHQYNQVKFLSHTLQLSDIKYADRTNKRVYDLSYMFAADAFAGDDECQVVFSNAA